MTPKEIKQLVKTLRNLGVKHYEANGIVFDLGPEPVREDKSAVDGAPGEIPHVVQELQSVMRLSDNDLVNRLFPEPKEEDSDEL